MPLNFSAPKGKVYLPGKGSYSAARSDRQRALYGSNTNVFKGQQFKEPEGTIFVEGGRAGVKGGDLLTDIIRGPAHMIEAPLRPFNAMTQGGLAKGIAAGYQNVKGVPVLHQALSGVEGVVDLLDTENKAVRAGLNQGYASMLAESIGKMPNEILRSKDVGDITVGDFRRKILDMWGINDYTGEPFTLEQLEQMALDNNLGFGEFRVDQNGLVSLVKEILASPSTYAFGTGVWAKAGKGAAKLITGTSAGVRAATWARPIVSAVPRATNLPRIGRGAMQAIRGSSWGAKPEFVAVREFMKSPPGRLGSLTLGSMVRVGSLGMSAAGKVYFPGYARLRRPTAGMIESAQRVANAAAAGTSVMDARSLRVLQAAQRGTGMGLDPVRAAGASWMAGGLGQMAFTSTAEHAMNAIGAREYDEEHGPLVPANGYAEGLQDLLHDINNNHPMSDNRTFMMLSLFTPWNSAINSAWKARPGGRPNAAKYYDKAHAELQVMLGQLTGNKAMKIEEFLAYEMKRTGATRQELIDAFEHYADDVDVMLSKNQLSHFAQANLTTVESAIHRQTLMRGMVEAAVIRKRETGALQPKSLAEMMIQRMREGDDPSPLIRAAQLKRTITRDGFYDFVLQKYRLDKMTREKFGPTTDIIMREGGTVSKEYMQGLRNMLNDLDDADIVPRDRVALIIEKNPWLMHQTEFWSELSITLGQKAEKTGKTFGREAFPQGTEGITVRELKEYIDDYIEELPSEKELFHEQLFAERRAVESREEAMKIAQSKAPDEMPGRLKDYRRRVQDKAKHSVDMKKKIISIRNAEFFKNGKPKWATAKTLRGHFKGLFENITAAGGRVTFRKKSFPHDLNRLRPPVLPRQLPDNQHGWSTGGGYDVKPGEFVMEFKDADRRSSFYPASDAYRTTVGNKDVFIFKPVKSEMVIGAGSTRKTTTFVPELYRPQPKYGEAGGLQALKADRWYVARADGNGTLLTNTPFTSEKRAVNWLETNGEHAVKVQMEDGVFYVDGMLPNRKPNQVMDDVTSADFEWEIASRLGRVSREWADAGRKGTPDTIVYEKGDPYKIGDEVMDTHHLYYIGDDGLPMGIASIDRSNGHATDVSIYVTPEYRGDRPGGIVSHRLYDEAFVNGLDLSNISGINNTPKGRAFSDKYWSTRPKDTIDTEGLYLAIENGGRITEQPVRQPITVERALYDIEESLDPYGEDIEQLIDFLYASEGYLGPATTSYRNFAEILEAAKTGNLRATSWNHNDMEAIFIRQSGGNVGDLLALDHRGGGAPIVTNKKTIMWTELDTEVRKIVNYADEVLSPGGVEHADTLARAGMHEVARYGDVLPTPLVRTGRHSDWRGPQFQDPEYFYRIDKVGSLKRLQTQGMAGTLNRNRETFGVYFGVTGRGAQELVPDDLAAQGMMVRVKRSEISTTHGQFPEEVVAQQSIAPHQIEYYGTDGIWHRMDETGEMAVFAYRGGDVTKAVLNSRIQGANPPYKPSARRTGKKKSAAPVPRTIKQVPAHTELSRTATVGGLSNEHMFVGEDAARIWELDVPGSVDKGYIMQENTPASPQTQYRLWTQELEDAGGSKWFGSFNDALEFLSRDVPNPDFKPTDTAAARKAALNIARKRANDASLTYPTLDTLGQGYSNSRRFFSPEERRTHLNELADEMDKQITSSAQSMQYFDDVALAVGGLRKVASIDNWFQKAMPDEIAAMRDNIIQLNTDYPGTRLMDGELFADPLGERFGHLMATRSMMARMVYDYGYLSPINRFFDAFQPHSSVWVAKEQRKELEVQMRALGVTQKQMDKIYEGIRERIIRSRAAEGWGSVIGSYLYRNARALPEGELRGIIEDAAGVDKLNAIIGRHTSVHRMLTESSAGVLRRTAERERHGGKVGKLEAAVNSAFRHYQHDPGLKTISGGTHFLSKFAYPLFRFYSDPLFAGMNLIEPVVYGISRNGINKTLRKRNAYQQAMNERVFRETSRSGIPAGGFSDVENLPIEIMMQDSGMLTLPRNIKPFMLADHEITRLDQMIAEFKRIPENDPLAILMQERFGKMSGDNWARGMEDTMYGFMNESIEGMTRKEFAEYMEELGLSAADREMMTPFINRITEMQRGLTADLTDLYVGRMRRSTAERVLDNFWLFWPLSYLVKATTWMATIMFKRVGGINTGALGGYLYLEYRDRFLKALESDTDMQEWMQDNRDWFFLFEMLLPMSPESIGMSLSPGTRMASSWLNATTLNSPELTHLLGDYSYVESIPEGLERTIRFGPIRTYQMFRRLANSMEVPGWTYNSSPVRMDRSRNLPGGITGLNRGDALAGADPT